MPDPGLSRVSVHTDTAVVDLTLPSRIPIAVLIPSIVDILDSEGGEGGPDYSEAWRYELSLPGVAALSGSTTLADNAIRDGTVLVLARDSAPLGPPRYDDAAHVVSATLVATARPWGRRATRLTGAIAASSLTGTGGLALLRNSLTHNQAGAAAIAACAGLAAWLLAVSAHRAWGDPIAALTLSLISASFAAVAGFLAVPGRPGTAHALLAAAAAAATAVLAMKAASCGAVTLTAIACTGAVIGVAALAGVLTSAPLHTLGSVSTVVSLGLLGVAARVSIIFAGLSPAPDPDETGVAGVPAKAIHADQLLTSLLWAFASTAAVGAVVTVFAGAPRLCCIGFGSLTGALLLLRSRGNDVKRTLVFVITGMTVAVTTFGVSAVRVPEDGQWVAAGSAVLAGAAMCLGFIVPARSPSPVVRRGVALLEASALVAMVPLTCWICGLYGAVRGLVLG